MTVFKDIAGWREELKEFQSGPVYKKMYPTTIRDPKDDPLVPKSVILDFVETLLTHEETRNALRDLDRWHKANPPETNPDPDNDPTFPQTSRLQYDFLNWYMLKTGYGPRFQPYFSGLSLAVLILNGEIPDVRSAEADAYLRKAEKLHIDFNN